MLLKFLRKRKNMKRIMWTLAILIIPAFVMWGVGTSSKKRKGPNYAGKIFNRKVSFEEYSDMWRVTRDYAIRQFGNDIPPELIDQLTWNRILLLEFAKRENIIIKDADVLKKIVSFPVFQRNGTFDKKLYKSILREGAKGFEERLRDDIRISKLKEKLTSRISITDAEAKEDYRKKFEKVKASYISIPFSDFEKDVQHQESELAEFYKENRYTFRKPEMIDVKYIEIPFSGFGKEVYITKEEINRFFEEHISDYKKPGSKENPALDEAIKKEISKKLTLKKEKSLAEELSYKVMDEVLDKKNLDETARSFALETKETGFFSMQEEVPGIGWLYEFTKRGFQLKQGEISNVLIKGDRGFYIIQLKARKASYIPGFAEARSTVTNSFIKNKSIKFAEEQARKIYLTINNKIKKGGTFEEIAKEIGKKVLHTDFITRSGYIPRLGPAKEFVKVGVSLKIGEIGGPIKMPEDWVILKLDDYQGIDEVKFAEDRENFKKEVLSKKKEAFFNKWFERAKKEADFVNYTSK